MSKFICHYEFMGMSYQVEIDEMVQVAHGFWLDSSMELTDTSDELHIWIPPSRIIYVKREEE